MFKDKSPLIDNLAGGSFVSAPVIGFEPLLFLNRGPGTGLATISGSYDGVTYQTVDAEVTNFDIQSPVLLLCPEFMYYRIEVQSGGDGLSEFTLVQNDKQIRYDAESLITIRRIAYNEPDTYTKSEADALLSAKANASSVYTKSETNTLLNLKPFPVFVQSNTTAALSFGSNFFFGNTPVTAGTVLANRQFNPPISGVILGASIRSHAVGNAGSRDLTMYLVVDGVNYLIATTAGAGATVNREFKNFSLNSGVGVAVTTSSNIAIKVVAANNGSTDSTNVLHAGYLLVYQ